MMPRLALRFLGCLLGSALMLPLLGQTQTAPPLDAQARDARAQRQQLQADIQALHQKITASENARQEVVLQLRQSEQAISAQVRQLADLSAQQRQLAREVEAFTRQIAAQQQTLTARQQALGKQLQARYIQNPVSTATTPHRATQESRAFWATLLSGQTPHAIGRELAYLAYVSQAQADSLRSVQQSLAALTRAQTELRMRQQAQTALQTQAAQQKKDLERDYARREQVLIRINAQLREQRSQIDTLKRDQQRLNTLVRGLEAAVKKQAQQKEKQAEKQAEQAKQARATPAPAHLPNGLKKNLPRPVNGRVQGRFGAERPDGGVWRGIVLLAQEGEPVRAIAPGQVVYADWLKGFGNMLILDHGQEYMSIYAYNQSLLKSLGDTVATGDALATVGATGGQVQAGLYFEIRHKGAPVNPLLWLRP